MKKIQVFTIIGTRPDIIKMAPVIMELENNPAIGSYVIFTGQHRDLGQQILSDFEIRPYIDLNVMKNGQSLSELNAKILLELDKLFKVQQPDFVLGHGDTTTCFAAALGCFYNKIPFLHVEAGLRSHDLSSPFPEEFNRQLVTKFAYHHFATNKASFDNLIKEGIAKKNISIIGNTISDTIQHCLKDRQIIKQKKENIITITMHRREKSTFQLDEILREIRYFAKDNLQYTLIYPVHPNPKVLNKAINIFQKTPNVKLVSPMNYPDFLDLLIRSKLVITDSGGIQEEAAILNTQTLIVRSTTERSDGIESGKSIIAGHYSKSLAELIKDSLMRAPSEVHLNDIPFGAAKKISNQIEKITLAVG